MQKYIIIAFMVFGLVILNGCGEDEEELPTTGSVSGTITFMGTPPEGNKEIQVSIFSVLGENGFPVGPPDHYSEPFEEFTGKVSYTISGVSFGTYKLAAIGYENPDSPPGTPETVIGMYGFVPPNDMQSDSFIVSEENPDITGIDIIADYSMIKE